MITRDLAAHLKYLSGKYPVVSIMGPRQSGKTTLSKIVFPNKSYVNLEELDLRQFASEDPRGFLAMYPGGAIFDEIQYVPDLFSYIQADVDVANENGKYILTGSQNFLLMEKISQSLAGRVGITELLPLSYDEVHKANIKCEDVFDLIYRGFYPRIFDQDIDPHSWYKSYLRTYVERDVRLLKNITNLSAFNLFLKLCAGRIGQLINFSSMGTECGVSHVTIKEWISVLENSYIVYLLKPHHKNFNKRLVKQPKLYFHDTGLACYLLGIETAHQISTHYAKGALFENFTISELIKNRLNQGKSPNLYFWRDNHGHEVDVIFESLDKLIPIEIKSGKTINQEFLKGVNYWKEISKSQEAFVVYAGEKTQKRSDSTKILSWTDISEIFSPTEET